MTRADVDAAALLREHEGFLNVLARRFLRTRRWLESHLEDLMQVGRMAILHALSKYDATRSAFTTYAGWWILHAFQTLATKSAPMHLPRGAGAMMPIMIPLEENGDALSLHDAVADDATSAEDAFSHAELLATLKPRERRIVEALVVEGRAYKELAPVENLSEPSLLRIKTVALATLRTTLSADA